MGLISFSYLQISIELYLVNRLITTKQCLGMYNWQDI